MRLKGKVALISGSTRGIGRSIAQMYASEGASVAVTGRNGERGAKVVDRITDAGGVAEFFPLDVTDEASVAGVVAAVVERFGGLTTLVNNAAPTDMLLSKMKRLHDLATDEWDGVVRGTLTGNVFFACKHALPHLMQAGGASIINISSAQSVLGLPGFSAYAAAKGGMNAITYSIAAEYAQERVRCNTIIVGKVVSSAKEAGASVAPGQLTRVGNPDDIAYAATWLAADESEFVTGSLVTVDGGVSIMAPGEAVPLP